MNEVIIGNLAVGCLEIAVFIISVGVIILLNNEPLLFCS